VGRLDGKVVMITGAARGQGRSHAVTFAQEGAQIVACDVCGSLPGLTYPPSTPEDLEETVRQVEELDQRCLATVADVRDPVAMQGVVDAAVDAFGRIDVLHVNHGICHSAMWDATTDDIWDTAISVILTGAWRTTRLVIPHMITQGGGSIIFTSTSATLVSYLGLTHYTAAKMGVVGLMRTLSAELAPHSIRVNAIAPGVVGTTMALNPAMFDLFSGHEGATLEEAMPVYETLGLLPTPYVEPLDISYAALYLASDEARYVTGVNLAVDAGVVNQPPGIPLSANEELARLREEVTSLREQVASVGFR
jgi:(+)-trans-carveol dehydrogenase